MIVFFGNADVTLGKYALERHEAGDNSRDTLLQEALANPFHNFCAYIGPERAEQLRRELQPA